MFFCFTVWLEAFIQCLYCFRVRLEVHVDYCTVSGSGLRFMLIIVLFQGLA